MKNVQNAQVRARGHHAFIDTCISNTDVNSAYRHIPIAAESARLQCVSIPEFDIIIIDLAAPFGNKASGYAFDLPATIINDLHNNSEPHHPVTVASAPETFCSSKWADDSALVDYSLLSRLQESKWAQYKAMVLTLGPSAIQMDKDTPFFTFGSCLGLLIDTKANEVSMKQEKIDKALFRIANVKASTRISKTVGLELLGSLRYVSLVLRPAQAFIQRIQRFVSRIARGRSKYVTAEVRDDLSRLEQALFIASLNATPFDTILRTTVPDVWMHVAKVPVLLI